MGLDGRPKQKYEKNKFDTHKKKWSEKRLKLGCVVELKKLFEAFGGVRTVSQVAS